MWAGRREGHSASLPFPCSQRLPALLAGGPQTRVKPAVGGGVLCPVHLTQLFSLLHVLRSSPSQGTHPGAGLLPSSVHQHPHSFCICFPTGRGSWSGHRVPELRWGHLRGPSLCMLGVSFPFPKTPDFLCVWVNTFLQTSPPYKKPFLKSPTASCPAKKQTGIGTNYFGIRSASGSLCPCWILNLTSLTVILLCAPTACDNQNGAIH